MSDTPELKVSVVTPDGVVYENNTSLVICKTTNGEIGLMANHMPLLATLTISEVKIKLANGNYDEVAVGGGFLEFSNNTLSIVANVAERKENIDTSRAERARDRAKERIEKARSSHDDDELRRAEISLKRAINRIKVSGH